MATVNTVKPKLGKKMAFEAAYKLHVAKFHKADEKIAVYEIISGDNAGYYHLVNSERSYADIDKKRPDAVADSLDLDKTFFPYLEDTRNGTYRLIDSLSLRLDVVADKFVVNVSHLKSDLVIADYRRELSRNVKIYLKVMLIMNNFGMVLTRLQFQSVILKMYLNHWNQIILVLILLVHLISEMSMLRSMDTLHGMTE